MIRGQTRKSQFRVTQNTHTASLPPPRQGFESLSSPGQLGVEENEMDNIEILRQHFVKLPPEQQVGGWEEMWQKSITPWDRNEPNPALVEALEKKPYLVNSPFKEGGGKTRKKVLVPGCGKGYDVLLFSSYGYDAVGLDAAPTAIEGARKLQMDQGKEQRYPIKNIQNGRGEATFLLEDFFKDDFLSQTHTASSEPKFDLIYDYTFLCALKPELRPVWAARMSSLLSPNGLLICLEYPLGKKPKAGGPPFGLESELYEQLLAKPGGVVNYNLSGWVCEDRSGDKTDSALVRVEHWRPGRTFDAQKGKVMMSTWQHWKR